MKITRSIEGRVWALASGRGSDVVVLLQKADFKHDIIRFPYKMKIRYVFGFKMIFWMTMVLYNYYGVVIVDADDIAFLQQGIISHNTDVLRRTPPGVSSH